MGDDAIACREHVEQVGSHLAVDGDRSLDAQVGAGVRGQVGVGPDSDHHEHKVCREAQRAFIRTACLNNERRTGSIRAGGDRLDARVAGNGDVVALELGAYECPELRVDGGKHLGQLL